MIEFRYRDASFFAKVGMTEGTVKSPALNQRVHNKEVIRFQFVNLLRFIVFLCSRSFIPVSLSVPPSTIEGIIQVLSCKFAMRVRAKPLVVLFCIWIFRQYSYQNGMICGVRTIYCSLNHFIIFDT